MSASSQRLGLWTACLAQLMVVLDVSVVNVALPSVQADLGLAQRSASWVAMAYSLGFAGVLLVGARLADVFGTVRVLAWGVGAFTLASTVGGLATEGWLLIAARGAQGLSAAVVSPATFTLLTTTHAEGPNRTRAIATWTAVSLAGGGLGNVASGVLTDLLSWRATLLINLPIGVCVVTAATALRNRDQGHRSSRRIDLAGAGLATAAFTSGIYALSSLSEPTAGALPVVIGVVSGVLFAVLALQQRHTPNKLVPDSLSRDRLIVLGNAATGLTAACFQVGLWYFLTYRMQDQLGYSPIQAGLAFLPLTATMLSVNLIITPRLMDRHSPQVLIAAGAVLTVPALLWLAVRDHGPFALTILVPSVAIGLGGALINTPLATLVTTGVRAEDAGAASGLMNTSKQFGGAIGLAAASTVAALAGTDHVAFAFMALAVLAAAAVAVVATRRPVPPRSATTPATRPRAH
ncbi:MFS transporter [Janibacter limosus]|uniref:MFS transporter n=1 Tax=Janibacter limosus TaxID=53458 RepID=UPI0008365E59|nr:MFS transporter [Janibacter limosus]